MDQMFKNQSSSNRNLEIQLGQLANAFPSRELGKLPSNIEGNLKENVLAIALWSGKVAEPNLSRNQCVNDVIKVPDDIPSIPKDFAGKTKEREGNFNEIQPPF